MLTVCKQCALLVFQGLLKEPHSSSVLSLLYHVAEWHAYAKLRLHTDATLLRLESLTKELGQKMRKFQDDTCKAFETFELPKETEARNC